MRFFRRPSLFMLARLAARGGVKQSTKGTQFREAQALPNPDGDASFFDPEPLELVTHARNSFRVANTAKNFEVYCNNILRSAGWTVSVIGAAGDQGADVIARYGGITVVTQCKLYGKPTGNRAVQEVYAANAHYKADFALVVCDAGFIPAARALANSTNVRLIGSESLRHLASTFGIQRSEFTRNPAFEIRRCLSCYTRVRLPSGKSGLVKCPICKHRFLAHT